MARQIATVNMGKGDTRPLFHNKRNQNETI